MSSESISRAISEYCDFIIRNPIFSSELEVALRWVSYFSAGHFSHAAVISELFHSSSNLLTLLNDTILRKAANIPVHLGSTVEKLQISLSVIEYVEVFIEVAARRLGGNKTKWLMIVVIQLIKSGLRLVLMFMSKRSMQKSPPISPLNRRIDIPQFCEQTNNNECCVRNSCSSEVAVTFSLKRSGRIIRTLEAAPPLSGRTWRLPMAKGSILNSSLTNSSNAELSHSEMIAELLHIFRPLVHLTAMGTYGKNSWKPWMSALVIDIISLHCLKGRRRLNKTEKMEWNRRALNLLAYLMRSPFYNNFSKYQILYILEYIAENVRGTGIIFRPLIEYIAEWQKTYFYVWSI